MQKVKLILFSESSLQASSKYGVKQHELLVIADTSCDGITQAVM